MVNTLKKVVLGVLLGATVTVAFGAVNTFACDKADDPAEKWAEAREQMIENYKADLEEKKEEEKAARQAISDEMDYKLRLADDYRKDVAFADFYVRAVEEQTWGLNPKNIQEAQAWAAQQLNTDNWWHNLKNSFKTQKAFEDYMSSLTEEQKQELYKTQPKWDPNVKENFEAYKRAFKAIWPNGHVWQEEAEEADEADVVDDVR